MEILKWGKIGLGIKRWILLSAFGFMLFIASTVLFFGELDLNIDVDIPTLVISSILGMVTMIYGIYKMIKSIVATLLSYKNLRDIDRSNFNSIFYKEKILPKKPKIVVIGGGTGLSVMLRGLKEYTSNITAIVTVADDGGSSGMLRDELHMLPPGDIRNCILALVDTEPTMDKVLRYRFKEGSLSGQSFGNLFIAAMNDIYGDFNIAIKEMSNVLAVKGRVLPMTSEDVVLRAELEDGSFVVGESIIPEQAKKRGLKIKKVFLEPSNPSPLKESIDAIKSADCIVFGPGSLYTSIMPNLLVSDIVKVIESVTVPRIYVGNIMTQPGETDDFGFKEHIEALINHSSPNMIDYAIANIGRVGKDVLEPYIEDRAKPVILSSEDEEWIDKMGITLVKERLVDTTENNIRHNSKALSQLIYNIALKSQVKRKKSRGEI